MVNGASHSCGDSNIEGPEPDRYLADEDLSLILRFQEHQDEIAFSVLYCRYLPKMVRSASRQLESADDAEDIVQTVFVEIFSRKDYNPTKGKFASWIFQILRNRVVDFFRKKRRIPELLSFLGSANDDEVEAAHQEDVKTTGRHDSENTIFWDELLATLPDQYGCIIRLRELDGCSTDEIAGFLGITPANALKRSERARKALRKAYDKAIGQ